MVSNIKNDLNSKITHENACFEVNNIGSFNDDGSEVILNPTSTLTQRSIPYNFGFGLLISSFGFYVGYNQSICNPLGEK